MSSQFVSALLFVLPGLTGPSTIEIVGKAVSRPYIEASLAVLRSHGVRILREDGLLHVPAPQTFAGRQFFVPGDASSAAYLWAAAATSGGTVRVSGLDPQWPQADLRILEILREMGARVLRREHGATVEGPLRNGCDVDLTDAPDLFPLVGALAASAPDGPSLLRGAPQLVHKESDRRTGTERLANELGAEVRHAENGIEIRPGSGVAVGHVATDLQDHRMVMSAAVAALASTTPTEIGDGEAVAKSFPEFWKALGQLGAEVSPAA